MIFIYNSQNVPVTLRAIERDEKMVDLVLKLGDWGQKTIIEIDKEECPILAATLLKMHGDFDFVIKEGITKINPVLHKKYYVFDKSYEHNSKGQDYTGICFEFSNTDEESQKKYRNFSWNLVITLTSENGKTYVDSRNTTDDIHQEISWNDDKTQSVKFSRFCIKWGKWNALKFPIDILVSDKKNVRLSASAFEKETKSGKKAFENQLIETAWDTNDRIPTDEEIAERKKKYKERKFNKKPYGDKGNYKKDGYKKEGYKKTFGNNEKKLYSKPSSYSTYSSGYGDKKKPYNKDDNGSYNSKKSYSHVAGTKNKSTSKRFNKDFYNK